MICRQGGRRNFDAIDKAEAGAKLLPLLAVQAKERQIAAGGDRKSEQAKSVRLPGSEPISGGLRSRDIAGEMVGCSGASVERIAKILAGVNPVYAPFTGTDAEILKLVVSLNLHRRHLTESQRAMIAAEIANLNHFTNQHTKEATPIGVASEGMSIPAAAKLMNVGTTSVDRAKRVVARGTPELKDAVVAGAVTVTSADRIARLPIIEQPAALAETVANPPRNRPQCRMY